MDCTTCAVSGGLPNQLTVINSNKKNPKKSDIEWNKIVSEFRNKARKSECFYHNKDECSGKIKKAHSIQRNGRLSLIEEEINGNNCLYAFTEPPFTNPQTKRLELKPMGKADASTFMGFCDYHDSILFQEIENNEFDDSDKHIFLHSYRAFAHDHHRKHEQINAFSSESRFNKLLGPRAAILLEGTKMGIKDGEIVRKRFERNCEMKKFDELESYAHQFDHFFPIAASASMTPKFSPKTNTMLNYYENLGSRFEHVFTNVIPSLNGTIFILACYPEDKKSVQYIDEFSSLPYLKQDIILSSILISEIENTFISPSIYKKLTETEKSKLIEDLHDTSPCIEKILKKHYIGPVNFFDRRFVKNVL